MAKAENKDGTLDLPSKKSVTFAAEKRRKDIGH
jgi:hypothetical protein